MKKVSWRVMRRFLWFTAFIFCIDMGIWAYENWRYGINPFTQPSSWSEITKEIHDYLMRVKISLQRR